VSEVDRCDATSKVSAIKAARGRNSALRLVRTLLMQNAEQQIAEKRQNIYTRSKY
jgi:hypothetical protein